jgi:fructose-1,6-bisphosphatase/inositol monophosphatase family enzyme
MGTTSAGVRDFAFFWRTLPRDQAAGVLVADEAGGVARRLDGGPYLPTDPPFLQGEVGREDGW